MATAVMPHLGSETAPRQLQSLPTPSRTIRQKACRRKPWEIDYLTQLNGQATAPQPCGRGSTTLEHQFYPFPVFTEPCCDGGPASGQSSVIR